MASKLLSDVIIECIICIQCHSSALTWRTELPDLHKLTRPDRCAAATDANQAGELMRIKLSTNLLKLWIHEQFKYNLSITCTSLIAHMTSSSAGPNTLPLLRSSLDKNIILYFAKWMRKLGIKLVYSQFASVPNQEFQVCVAQS